MTGRHQPPLPWLCLVTDHTVCASGVLGLERIVMTALDCGVNVVQLREKALPARELYELARRLRRLTSEAGALLLVNDRADVALAAGADGVHLSQAGLPVSVARQLIGDRLVGRSVHAVAEAVAAQEEGADYVVLGTIFPSATHPEARPAGPSLIRKVKAHVKVPVLAIGGITADNAGQAIAAGADGVAVIRAILADARPECAAGRLVARVREAWPTAALHRGSSDP